MKIFYYTLGVYPERAGGLVRYSTDLAKAVSNACEIIYVYPGKLGFIDKKMRFVKENKHSELNCYRIENSLPIPVFAGIKNTDLYTRKGDIDVYTQFLKEMGIDIVHIHTLMGLHIELLEAAHILNIPVVMTVHDYFGICPITTLFRNGEVCNENSISSKCGECSCNAFSYFKLSMAQTRIYKILKKNPLFKIYREKFLSDGKSTNKCKNVTLDSVNYEVLDRYYKNEFYLVDMFLFNSEQTKTIYEKRVPIENSRVIPLLHNAIVDSRKEKSFMKSEVLKLGFLGELTQFKGYDLACGVARVLNSIGCKVILNVYNDAAEENEFVIKRGNYKAEELEQVFSEIDILLVPSMWRETLGFIVLEALAHGVPCIVSDRVGAKMFIKHGVTGYILEPQEEKIVDVVYEIYKNPVILKEINQNILKESYSFDMEKHVSDIIDIYHFVK